MGGRRPYGFELAPAVLHNVRTKKLSPIPAEAEQIQYIYRTYAQENLSLRRMSEILATENRCPSGGNTWSASTLSTLLKKPIYVKADFDIYGYYDLHHVQMITVPSLFTGEYGVQLYGHTKHRSNNHDWST